MALSLLYLIDASTQARLVGSNQDLLCGDLACRLSGYLAQQEVYRNVFTIYRHPSGVVEPLTRSAHGLPCLKFSGRSTIQRPDDNRTMTAIWCYDCQRYQIAEEVTSQPNQ